MSDIAKVDEIEMQELGKNTEDLISQMTPMDDLFEHPLLELLGLDKQLRSIRGLVKVEMAKRFSWKNPSRKKNESLREFGNILENTMMAFEKTSPSESTS